MSNIQKKIDYLFDIFFKYILHFFLLYITINIIIRKHYFKGNEKNIIMICFISSFICFVVDIIENNEKNKKDFLSNLSKDSVLQQNNLC
jgi:hypothetical protein